MRVPHWLSASLFALIFAVVSGCRGCDGGEVKTVRPVIGLSSQELGWAKVKIGTSIDQLLALDSQSQAAVTVSLSIAAGPDSAAFELVDPPSVIPQLGRHEQVIRFHPTEARAYSATLIVESDDPERPRLEVALSGEGAVPVMVVTPTCDLQLGCKGQAVVDPPSIDFGEEPFQRGIPLPAPELPRVRVTNTGAVDLLIKALRTQGAHASAFKIEGNSALPQGGLPLAPNASVEISLRFQPTSEMIPTYTGELVIEGDDPQRPIATVQLTGALGENLAPRVCANVVRVKRPGEPEQLFTSESDWAPLLVPPMGGYDFTATRDIRPLSEVRFSAISKDDDPRACTSDPEDGRVGLTYQWSVVSAPSGAGTVALLGATTPTATLSSQATVAAGEYVVQLVVKDAQGHASSTLLRFAVVPRQDLTVQLSWNGDQLAYAKVDLDLHLVRPSSATAPSATSGLFGYFDEGAQGTTSGDLNGYSYSQLLAKPDAGFNFDWGQPGGFDDPSLNIDDSGNGQLIENVSLNYPENDPACATESCTYKVFVHYFEDGRTHAAPSACSLATPGCADGKACNCADPEARCVASTAPKGASPSGSGVCLPGPEPVVRIFVQSSATPAAVIPLEMLMPPDSVKLGAPCHALYVADIVWPAKSTLADGGTATPVIVARGADASGRITAPEVFRFGVRSSGSLFCSPNAARGGASTNWFAEEPL